MTDPTAPTAEDVIAEAAHAAIFDYSQTDAWPILGDDARAADFIAAAVVAAIRAMSVQQQAELIGGEVQNLHEIRLQADGMFWPVPGSRVVGPWQETP